MARLDPVSGLFVESLLLSVMVVALVLYSDGGIEVPVGLTVIDWSLLLSCGLVSLIPLTLFAFAAKNLPLSVMGLLQFVLPLTQFCVAVIFYGQIISFEMLVAFLVIFLGMILVVLESPLKMFLRIKWRS